MSNVYATWGLETSPQVCRIIARRKPESHRTSGVNMPTNEHAVVVAGGGPTGMMLAAELALAGVDVAVVERRPDHAVAGSRAGGFHARTIEVLDQRGVADRFLAAGAPVQVFTFGTAKLDMSDFPSRHPYTLSLFQREIE